MNTKRHVVVGGTFAALYYVLDAVNRNKQINLLEVIGSFLIGTGAAILPDLIEPATSPNHRGFFHSVAFSSLPITYLMTSHKSPNNIDSYRWIKNALAIGYLSHLALDGLTPKSLPFFM